MIYAAILSCLVIGVTDGDTMKALCPTAQESPAVVKIRLSQIDAPEKRQPFGQQSKQALSNLCFQEQATIYVQGLDKYKRTLARVSCKNQDAASHMVQSGMAWAYTKYLTDPNIKAAQTEAQQAHRGLWTDDNPTPPWEWRHPKQPSNGL